MNNFWTAGFWAKPIMATVLCLFSGLFAYLAVGTPTAAAMGFGAPTGFWIIYELVRLGGATFVIDLFAGILDLMAGS